MSKPTIAEQIEAVATLRIHAIAGSPTDRVVSAINTLDDAGLFAALDEARDELEAAADPGAPNGRGKCPHCGHPRVPLTPQGLTMYHGDVESGKGDCIGSLSVPVQPLDPAEWGDTTREDMARHQQIGLPELKPGEEPRPAFSDTHPRAARELGEMIQRDQS